ncbi:MAG: hypothetical protein H6548_10335 [Chitinophagales bacterium]|nr:hypothetical protein [Chitinophagales bacterium]HAE14439.1 hypothetical protein [Bacteroidota bacterium]MCB9022504.1 hypothetical protein [Chitinophagales bacterium]HPE98799.1 hypothetical protein [Chitinophagales bacterium]HQU40687.1 hypothetical protein [Chitinophagales bacterium]
MAINNTHIILFQVAMFSMVSSCIKPFENVEDYLPVVSMDSVVINDDGNISLYGHILDEGFTDIQHAGFCYSENEEFSILENQLEVTTYGSFFKLELESAIFENNTVYYFNAWASNKQGYAKGEPISTADITNEVIAPCSFDTNYFYLDAFASSYNVYYASALNDAGGDWEITASVSGTLMSIHFRFSEEPSSGIYSSSGSTMFPSDPEKVYVSVTQGGPLFGYLQLNEKIYLNNYGDGSYSVTLCDAVLITTGFGETYHIDTYFLGPY